MAGKYRNESKHRINGRENTGTKVNITLMVWKYRNEVSITLVVTKYRNKRKYHTNGRKIQERK